MRARRDFGTVGSMKRMLMMTSAAAMIAMAAPAYADPPSDADADFISQLKAAGVTFHDPAAAIAAAKNMCKLVDTGTPYTELEKNLETRNPGLTAYGAAEFVTLAAGEYCPKYLKGEVELPKPPGAQGN
jgi:Protein of unknown function (DUF732)